MGIGDGRLGDILIDGLAAFLITAFERDRDAGAGGQIEFAFLVEDDLGSVAGGVDLDMVVAGGFLGTGAGDDLHRFARGQEAIHAGGADADALLAAAHLEGVKLAAVQKPGEDIRHLLLDDAGAVVFDGDGEFVFGVRHRPDVDGDIGQDVGLFAGVEGIIDGLLDRREQGLAGIVESEQVAVFGEEFADGDVPLLGGHRFGGGGLVAGLALARQIAGPGIRLIPGRFGLRFG